MLLELGVLERIDADRLVHTLMTPGTAVTDAIRQTFGPGVVRPDGSVDRARLGRLVFADPDSLRRLEEIVHPAVRRLVRERIQRLEGQTGIVVVDAVKLLQSELLELCDAVWVVQCSSEAQRRRLTEVRQLTDEEAQSRLNAQPSFLHSRVMRVIENSGSVEELRREVEAGWRDLQEDSRVSGAASLTE
jgi:dephospho-CoA kinase